MVVGRLWLLLEYWAEGLSCVLPDVAVNSVHIVLFPKQPFLARLKAQYLFV